MPRPSTLCAIVLALLAATACASFRVGSAYGDGRDGPTTRTLPGAPPGTSVIPVTGPTRPGAPPAVLPTGELPGPTTGTRYADERRVCRTSGVPRGWIAVAYVDDAGSQCPARTGADSLATSMVLTRYADRPRGTDLDVCADQRLPRGWERVMHEDTEDATRCPGAAPEGKSTTRRIRRMR